MQVIRYVNWKCRIMSDDQRIIWLSNHHYFQQFSYTILHGTISFYKSCMNWIHEIEKKMYSVDRREGLRWQRESAGNAHTAQTVNIFLTFFRLLRHMGQAPTSSAILQCKKYTPYQIPLIPKKLHSNICSKNTSDFSSFPYPLMGQYRNVWSHDSEI